MSALLALALAIAAAQPEHHDHHDHHDHHEHHEQQEQQKQQEQQEQQEHHDHQEQPGHHEHREQPEHHEHHDHGDHAGHGPEVRHPPRPPVAPPPPGAFQGPAHAADSVFGEEMMGPARERLRREHGDIRAWRFLADEIEARIGRGHYGYAWDAQFWYGGDIDKLWLKSAGEGEFGGGLERVELQALWSRAIDPWFDLQLGLRQDFRPRPRRTHLVVGVQGLAPYWFEVEGALFLSHEGELTARFEAEYDLRITQRLILQPAVELELSAQDVPELGIGRGLSGAEAGLRLRYEIIPQFAPYVGVHYERAVGRAARFAREAGEEAGRWSLLIGLRTWF